MPRRSLAALRTRFSSSDFVREAAGLGAAGEVLPARTPARIASIGVFIHSGYARHGARIPPSLLANVDPELPALLVEVAPLQAQAARGVRDVPAVGPEPLADDVPFV